jgi:short subunit dehydrogenase-like uncharacterized protein
MAETADQSGPIAVYGATGYTGRLVAAELHRRRAKAVLAGRDGARLEMIAAGLGPDFAVRAVPLDDAAGLRRLLEPCAAVIACAGPFVRYGEPVLAAAIDAGAHYLDTTGEQAYMRIVFERHGARAERAGVALVSAMGFDYVPGDLLAALLAEGMGELKEVRIAYGVRGFGPTRGTAASGLEIMRRGGVEWRGGGLVADGRPRPAGTHRFPAPIGEQSVLRWPGGEHLTVPRHVAVRTVSTLLGAGMVLPDALSRLLPFAVPPLQLAMRTPLARGAEAMIRRMPPGPAEEERKKARFAVAGEAYGGGGRRSGVVVGRDPYDLTARMVAHGALLASAAEFGRSGALAPAQAFEPGPFLDALAPFGVSYGLDPRPGGE